MGDTQVIAANGILRQEQRFNLIANNLSNIQTAGFKKDVPVFSKILSQSSDRFGASGNQISVILFQQGDLQRTGNELNLAIEGEGFFKVQTPWGVRYTRNGNFSLNQAGTLIDGNGFPVMGSRDEISLRGGKTIQVQPNGAVQADGQEVDRISLVTFADLRAIQKEGHTYFRAAEGQEEIEASDSQVAPGGAGVRECERHRRDDPPDRRPAKLRGLSTGHSGPRRVERESRQRTRKALNIHKKRG